MLRLGTCSDAVTCVVTSGAGAELEGPASDVFLVGGPAGAIT